MKFLQVVVGLHNIDWINRCATFGIIIGDEKYQNNGYGTQASILTIYWAFNSLNLHRINSSAFATNLRSIALHKKVGFVEEGRERESVFKNGTYQDVVLLSFLIF